MLQKKYIIIKYIYKNIIQKFENKFPKKIMKKSFLIRFSTQTHFQII